MTPIAVLAIGLLLAYANGANDNFKGVATLLGSGTTSYRRALIWATITTALGSLTALVLARGLLAAFSGKGLVAPEVVADPVFPAAVALAAGLTVLLVEQKLPFARKYADRFAILDRGRRVAEGDIAGLTDELIKQHLTV